MIRNLKKYGGMIFAAVFLIAVAGVGVADADAHNTTISSWQELEQNITEWGTNTEQLTIVLGADLTGTYGIDIYVAGNVTIMPSEHTDVRINANQSGRFFSVSGSNASLTLKGNTESTLNLTGGSMDFSGGGIYISDGGKFTLDTGAMITDCRAGESGGAVYVEDGTLILNGGNITGCTATGEEYGSTAYGGGIYLSSGMFTMNGGNITGCTALGTNADQGGGICLVAGMFIMNGGRIAGNSAAMGSGVFTSIPFNISGSATITADNTVALVRNDYDSVSTSLYVLNPDSFSGSVANITLYDWNYDISQYGWMENPASWVNKAVVRNGTAVSSQFALSASSLYEGCFLASDGSDLKLVLPAYVEVSTWEMLRQKVSEWTDSELQRTVAVAADIVDRDEENPESITVWGNVILTTTASPAGVRADEAVIDGKGLESLFLVSAFGNLTLCGNGTSVLNITGGDAASFMGGGIAVAGNLTLDTNAKITHCSAPYGGGVAVYANGVFTMNGGAIENCSADSDGYGGGVAIASFSDSPSVFTMNDGIIANCSAQYGGGVLNSGMFAMNGGRIANNTAVMGAGMLTTGDVYLQGDAVIPGSNDVVLCGQEDRFHNLTLTGSFTGQIDSIRLCDAVPADHPSLWLKQVIVSGGGDAVSRFGLASSDQYKGFRLIEQNGDIILDAYRAEATASGGTASFGKENYTVTNVSQTMVSKVLLEEVSKVMDGTVEFIACNTTSTDMPYSAGYSRDDIAVFDLNATANGTARFTMILTFQDRSTADANKNNVWFWHYNGLNSWNRLTSEISGQINANVTYTVETTSFSPIFIGIYTETSKPVVSTTSSRQTGSTVILSETAVPTSTPTQAPTPTPSAPSVPVTKPTPQQTQSSPVPFLGICAGLAACVFACMRR